MKSAKYVLAAAAVLISITAIASDQTTFNDPESTKLEADGKELLDEGNVDEAVAKGRSAVEITPDSAEGHAYLGWALFKSGQVDESIAEYTEAIRLDPKRPLPI